MTIGWLAVFGVAALVDWWATAAGRSNVRLWAKPLVMVVLIVAAWQAGLSDHPGGMATLVGLALSLLGDVALLSDTSTRFIAGLLSFFAAHVAYLVAFLQHGLALSWWGYLGGVAVLVAAFVSAPAILVGARREGGTAFAGAVVAYMSVIAAMAMVGWLTGIGLVAAGVTSFVASDTLLARERFVAPRPGQNVAVMVTYHLAQLAIAAGMLTTVGR